MHRFKRFFDIMDGAASMENIAWLCALVLPILLVIGSGILSFGRSRKLKLPPSPFPTLPVIGHLYLLGHPLHRKFDALSKKLGPIFSLRLGNRFLVVVSAPDAVEECFTKNDIVFANRPRSIISKYFGYNNTSLVVAPYGEHWRNLRRITTIEVFSTSRINTFLSTREDEIRILLQKLYRKSMRTWVKVELKSLFTELAFNAVVRMVTGKRYYGEENEEAKHFREMIKKATELGSVADPVDFFPLLRWIDYKGFEKKLSKFAGNMDAFLQALVDEHRHGENTDSMIDHLLSLQQSEPEYYTDDIIKGMLIVTINGGTDTSAVTIEWVMSCLLNNPEKLLKARAEIESLTGNERLINESDLPKLQYLQNIISETLRLFPVAPFLIPHESSADCKIGGFDIPQGTILFVNAWAIHRDPSIWNDPTSFKPERFEDARDIGTTKLLPFGMGRRACPGSGLANRVVGLTIGSLIQGFDWDRIDEAMVDMNEGQGITMMKAVPLEAICKARDVLHRALSSAA